MAGSLCYYECGKVLAITKGLHDVHSLEKEAAAVHTDVGLALRREVFEPPLTSKPTSVRQPLRKARREYCLAKVLAITEGLHDVHSLWKEATAVHIVAKATTMELMERVGALSRQTKKYQTKAEGLRAEKRKDEEIVHDYMVYLMYPFVFGYPGMLQRIHGRH
ncbi:hypothetical protein IFM89_012404 [Coptis chinensis]|uniref:Uncharacterized protein n=1 Tax=Coptis chinensis TaxID=261450 RepID=A0A835M7T3_9MAGN|nr:hypothetical protein IFM89_012404 [Coptis chinensis]